MQKNFESIVKKIWPVFNKKLNSNPVNDSNPSLSRPYYYLYYPDL